MNDSNSVGLRMVNLTKVFGNNRAVDGLNLEVHSGELFAFLGPNAAGKTTTIKLITGLLKPTEGQIFIGEHEVQKDYLQAKRLISYIPDLPYLYEKLTARELLFFLGNLYEMQRNSISRRSNELLGLFELSSYADQLIEDFSHGMRQKLVICCALLHDPKVIVIDEPMVGLDPKSVRLVKDLLKERSSKGTTIFMSTHTLSLAEELADRIGIIDRGRLIALGTTEELRLKSGLEGRLEETFLKLTLEEKKEEP